jgi:hypothetical protein
MSSVSASAIPRSGALTLFRKYQEYAMNKSIFIFLAAASATAAGAQSFTPVPAVPQAEAVEAPRFERTITVAPDQRFINVAENERVKLLIGGEEKVVDFRGQGVEKLEIAGKQLIAYVCIHPQHNSPGE